MSSIKVKPDCERLEGTENTAERIGWATFFCKRTIITAENERSETMSALPDPIAQRLPRSLARLLASSCVVIAAIVMVNALAPPTAVAPLPGRAPGPVEIERLKGLFGHASPTNQGSAGTVITDPSVRLHGVIVDSAGSVALISLNGGSPRAYARGAQLPGSIRLIEIDEEQVTLERPGGQRLTLKLPPRATRQAPPPPSSPRR